MLGCRCCPTFDLLLEGSTTRAGRPHGAQAAPRPCPRPASPASSARPTAAAPRSVAAAGLDAQPWALVPSWVWDGASGQSTAGQAVLVAGGQIVAVLAADDPAVTSLPAARRRELPGCTVLPGLIDAHVHATGRFTKSCHMHSILHVLAGCIDSAGAAAAS